MKPEKQHPDSINRDLDDEVAAAIEQQYARKLVKPAGNVARTLEQAEKDAVEEKMRKKSQS